MEIFCAATRVQGLQKSLKIATKMSLQEKIIHHKFLQLFAILKMIFHAITNRNIIRIVGMPNILL